MEEKEFFKEISDIFLYPGTLEELNDGCLQYKRMHLKGPKKFLRGIIIPSREETL
ncbi:MAG: hypothetical protein U9Q69_02455 [Nanoarchaeota archaeon]|nr:hypothetical protein [Nanoarchaeota archaeon]